MTGAIKICGITTADAIDAAAHAGATHAGFVFFAASPRATTTATALSLSRRNPSLKSVALTVDAGDDDLARIVAEAAPSMLQLHGSESPARVAAIRERFGLPVMKAVSIASAIDVTRARDYEAAADMLLFDASPDTLPGGNGIAFDWTLVAHERWSKPWMLSGGLTASSVAKAIHATGTRGVDVSSGVEKTRGVKDPQMIEQFIRAAKGAFAGSETQ